MILLQSRSPLTSKFEDFLLDIGNGTTIEKGTIGQCKVKLPSKICLSPLDTPCKAVVPKAMDLVDTVRSVCMIVVYLTIYTVCIILSVRKFYDRILMWFVRMYDS